MVGRTYGNREFSIGGRAVGAGHPAYVIAEAGSNHNRDLGTALRLIEVAAEAGADAVKFQTYTAEGLYARPTPTGAPRRFRIVGPLPWAVRNGEVG